MASAGGYYYLSKTSPDTIAAAERAVSAKTGVNVSGTPHTTNSALDPNKWVNFKLKEVKVRWSYLIQSGGHALFAYTLSSSLTTTTLLDSFSSYPKERILA